MRTSSILILLVFASVASACADTIPDGFYAAAADKGYPLIAVKTRGDTQRAYHVSNLPCSKTFSAGGTSTPAADRLGSVIEGGCASGTFEYRDGDSINVIIRQEALIPSATRNGPVLDTYAAARVTREEFAQRFATYRFQERADARAGLVEEQEAFCRDLFEVSCATLLSHLP